MIDDLDRAQAEVSDEIRALETRLHRKGYRHGKVEVAFNWIGHPVWIGVALTKRFSSDMNFIGETLEGSHSLAYAFQQVRTFIEGLSDYVEWSDELVGQTLGLEQPRAAAEAEAAAA